MMLQLLNKTIIQLNNVAAYRRALEKKTVQLVTDVHGIPRVNCLLLKQNDTTANPGTMMPLAILNRVFIKQ